MTTRPHDALFRGAFEHPDDAAGELRHVLPQGVVEAIDWSTLRLEPGSFIDPDLADRHSDLLFSAWIADAPALIYLLLEHQSTPDSRMPLRMLVYMVRIWERCDRESPTGPLPVIIPVLVSHSPAGWSAPRRMHELLDPRPESLPGLAELVPDFRLAVDDLARVSDDDLQTRSLATFPMLALALLRDGHSEGALFAHLEEWAATFAAVAAAPTGLQAFAKLMRYVGLRLGKQQFERFCVRLKELAPTTRDVMMSFTEQLLAEGEAKGVAKGRAEGRAEAQRDTLIKLLSLKFGTLDEPTVTRVRLASEDELERWIERILAAPSPAAVFEP